MITEDYVSFETAKLLKEKGFDEHCFCINYPLPEGEHHSIILPNLLNNSMIPFTDEYKFCRYKEDFITIPTFQMAMKWLREVHGIHIEICLDTLDGITPIYRACYSVITNISTNNPCTHAEAVTFIYRVIAQTWMDN